VIIGAEVWHQDYYTFPSLYKREIENIYSTFL